MLLSSLGDAPPLSEPQRYIRREAEREGGRERELTSFRRRSGGVSYRGSQLLRLGLSGRPSVPAATRAPPASSRNKPKQNTKSKGGWEKITTLATEAASLC